MTKLLNIKKLVDENKLEYCHYTLARFINDSIQEASEFCLWLSILVNVEINRGNVCLQVTSITAKSQQLDWKHLPAIDQLEKRIHDSPVVGMPDQQKPLIIDRGKIYLNRYYHNEKRIADTLLALSHGTESEIDIDSINRLFPPSTQTDYQKLSALVSSMHRLSIISGGPGTGKTWTVSRILAHLIQQHKADYPLNIKLAAPTGKAAARLSESIQKLQAQLEMDESVKKQMSGEAVTLHRLLGIHRFTHRPRYHRHNKLTCDVLVLDEASMIDQQMMAILCDALPVHCKLMLLGDKDQLSSVEAGSVFADLCGGLQHTAFSEQQQKRVQQLLGDKLPLQQGDHALSDQVVVLQKSHRFDDFSGIGLLAKSINQGEIENCLEQLKTSDLFATVNWQQPTETDLQQKLHQQSRKYYLPMARADSLEKAFELFHQYQILCAVWSGPSGVDTINATIESHIKSCQGIEPATEFYAGKPLMMSSNLYQYDIHNGDIGMLWPDVNDQLKIWFEKADGSHRSLSLSQCPQHKSAYAMTVHKSQGSEFNQVLLILPYTDTAVSTRELFYTGITRASDAVEIWASESIIEATVKQKTQRVSGLMERLHLRAASKITSHFYGCPK